MSSLDKSLLELEPKSFAFLIFSMIFPICFIALILFTSRSALLTVVLYCFVCLIFIPGIFISIFASGKRPLKFYFTGEDKLPKGKLIYILIGLVLLFLIHFILVYILFKNISVVNNLILPFGATKYREKGILAIAFIFYLPFLEEFFWRVFLVKSLGNYIWVGPLISLFYGLLNFVGIIFMLPWEYGLIAFIYFASLSLTLVYVKKMFKALLCVLIRVCINTGMIAGFAAFLNEDILRG